MAGTARLVYDDSERNADLYYLTRFLAGDPFVYVEVGGRRLLYLNDLEVDRGRAKARVDEVVRLEDVVEKVKEERPDMPKDPLMRIALYLERIARDHGVGTFEVPMGFPLGLADVLRGLGLGVRALPAPFVEQRGVKSEEEVACIRRAIRHTEDAIRAGIERIARADIRDGALFEAGRPLTSEMVRHTIDAFLLERGCRAQDTIVAGGEQGVDPHERGSGPLPANRPIILDVFPRDLSSRYHGDITRTVVRGKASPEVRRMFEAVRAAKAKAEAVIRDGVDGAEVHAQTAKTIEDAGFETGQRDGRMVGFFHGTGHGLGLEVHERPRMGKVGEILRAGHVVTVEPGLYYPGEGGMRIEDDVVVRKDGCENLCELEVVLEV